MPINPFEETPRERAVEQWISKHKFCFRLQWRINIYCRKKLKFQPPTVTDQMFHNSHFAWMEGPLIPPPDVHVSQWNRKKNNNNNNNNKNKKKKKKKNLTAVIPVGVGLSVNQTSPTDTTTKKETKEETKTTAAKAAWGIETKKNQKKKSKPILKRKTSLESNFSDNAVIHKYGCPKNSNNPYWKPNHEEKSLFNFKMRVKLRMHFRNYKSAYSIPLCSVYELNNIDSLLFSLLFFSLVFQVVALSCCFGYY